MAQVNRPLSPHLGIYKWQISNSLSILHRLTGISLAAGSLALVAWIVAIAMGESTYLTVSGYLAGPLGMLLLLAFSASFFYHLANGIRHLFWDAGYGFEREVARRSGWFVLSVAVLATVVFWVGVLA